MLAVCPGDLLTLGVVNSVFSMFGANLMSLTSANGQGDH